MLRARRLVPRVFSIFARTCTVDRPVRFGIGDVEQETKIPAREEFVPGNKSDPFLDSVEARDHLRWIMQKDSLGQDMLLMGGNCM